ncbi:MAG: hypothetical protein HOP17_00915 [Acidobacteria bacterium]|nr:hypothetical protein [Acidobacteriota bacterium]
MKNSKFYGIGVVFLSCFLISGVVSVFAQNPEMIKRLRPPDKEKFSGVESGLIIPRLIRQQTCGILTPNPEPPCREIISVKEQGKYSTVSIYNSDASIWSELKIEPRDPKYFDVDLSSFSPVFPNSEFKVDIGKLYGLIVMRITRESPDWYEVEINEKTRQTKFILKADPMWAHVDWYELFNMSFHVYIDPSRTTVLDAPNGKPIECKFDDPKRHIFSRLDGDWMLVNKDSPRCEGWIRWRNGRKMLVGSRLTDWKIPSLDDVHQR